MEVGGLAGDPREEAGKLRIGCENSRIVTGFLQFLVGEGSVQGAVADWVDRPCFPAAARLGHRVMLLDTAAERAAAQPAGGFVDHGRCNTQAGAMDA